jgi:oligopeptide transport system substrate-binding protein
MIDKKSLAFCSLVFLTLFNSCSTADRDVASKDGQILRIANGTEIETLDPHLMTGVPEHRVQMALYECLYRYDPKTSESIPGVAESCEAKDKKTFVCKIRKDAKWSNGEAVTAQDFVYSLRRIINPTTGSKYASMVYPVKNAKALNQGKLNDMTKLGVTAPNDQTLVIKLDYPAPYFTSMLSHYTYCPVHQKTIEKHDQKWTRPENFVGNGPYVLSYAKLQEKKVVTKNPHYWDRANVHIPEIVFYPTDNTSTMVRKFQKKEVHWSVDVPTTELERFKKKPEYYSSLYLGVYYYRVNVTKKPLNDVRIRKALAMSINRKLLTDQVTKAGQVPALSFVPPGTLNYGKFQTPITEDIKVAKKLLAEAGYPEGKGLAPIEILYNTNEAHKLVALAIGQMWKENLGIDAKPFNKEWKTYLQDNRLLNYQVSRNGWIADYNDPSTFLDMFTTGNDLNQTGWSNIDFDQLIEKANNSLNRAKRTEYLLQAEKILMDEVPVIPIYFYTSKNLVSSKLKGWYDNILDYHPYVGMTLSLNHVK